MPWQSNHTQIKGNVYVHRTFFYKSIIISVLFLYKKILLNFIKLSTMLYLGKFVVPTLHMKNNFHSCRHLLFLFVNYNIKKKNIGTNNQFILKIFVIV